MEPLFDEYAKRCCDEGDYKAQKPENVDENRVLRFLEWWRGEVRHGRIDEIPIDSEARNLIRKLYEDLVRKFFRLLLKVFVWLDDECRDDGRE